MSTRCMYLLPLTCNICNSVSRLSSICLSNHLSNSHCKIIFSRKKKMICRKCCYRPNTIISLVWSRLYMPFRRSYSILWKNAIKSNTNNHYTEYNPKKVKWRKKNIVCSNVLVALLFSLRVLSYSFRYIARQFWFNTQRKREEEKKTKCTTICVCCV